MFNFKTYLRAFHKLLFILLISTNANSEENIKVDIFSPSFSVLRSTSSTIEEKTYFDFIRVSIIQQPEYSFAKSTVEEKNMTLRFQKRHRLPELSLQVINDQVIDRDVTDKNSLRKRQDDSFDVAVELSQAIYQGGAINSRINIAMNEYNMSKIEQDMAFSNLILDANRIYLSALKSELLFNYSNEILEDLEPYMNKIRERVQLGISDPIELAIFSIKYNTLYSKVQRYKTLKNQDIGNFEYFFNTKFSDFSFPEILIPLINYNSRESYEVTNARLNYDRSNNETSLTKSEFRPQFGIRTRYTSYDIDDDELNDKDIRGGLYFSMPIFTFGRGSAKISSAKAKANASKMSIGIEQKLDDVKENEIVNIIESSQNTRVELYTSFLDTINQRKIVNDRIDVVSFSAEALVNSYIEEISLLENIIDTEINLLHGYFMYLHQNRTLISHIGILP